ncbi:MAG TPA: GYD domain-containing protein [Dehalococcoidia bacterium]|nr:GYD domain-containing protein [Dehalococcoidia bacterium]
MPTYLIQASYTVQGVSGLTQSPEDRSGVIRSLLEGLGGTLEAFYYAFGDYDVVEIVELPDSVSMAAFSMALGASGAVTNVKTTVLIPVSEGVEAARKAGSIGYRPPGS